MGERHMSLTHSCGICTSGLSPPPPPPPPPPGHRSLSSKQAALRPPELTAAVRSLRQQLLPRPAHLLPPAEVRQQEQQWQVQLIRQMLAPFTPPSQQTPTWGALQPAAAARVQAVGGTALAASHQPAGQQQQEQQTAGAAAGQPKGASGPPPPKRAKRGGAADMQYFLQLQRGGAAGMPATGPSSSSSSGEASAEEAVAAHLGQASTAVHSVELPAVHAQLLRLLREDEQRLVVAAPALRVPAEVARSDFLSVDALQRALRATAGAQGEGQPVDRLQKCTSATLSMPPFDC